MCNAFRKLSWNIFHGVNGEIDGASLELHLDLPGFTAEQRFFLSFARVGLSAPAMLDPGPFGCIGVGVPYGIAANRNAAAVSAAIALVSSVMFSPNS